MLLKKFPGERNFLPTQICYLLSCNLNLFIAFYRQRHKHAAKLINFLMFIPFVILRLLKEFPNGYKSFYSNKINIDKYYKKFQKSEFDLSWLNKLLKVMLILLPFQSHHIIINRKWIKEEKSFSFIYLKNWCHFHKFLSSF